jgi:TetR/AcrR family transcriptional repressor of mexJK operon
MNKSLLVKDKILNTAIKLFSKHGFDRTSFQLIADTSKVSATTPLYYFKTKNALIDEALSKILINNSSIVDSAIKANDSAYERLLKHFRMNLKWAIDFPDEAQIILLVYYRACFDKKTSEIYLKIRTAARYKILEFILAGKREGLFKKDLDAELTAEILHDLLLGGIMNAITVNLVDKNSYNNVLKKWEFTINKLLIHS